LFIARATGLSRRKADSAIQRGAVSVNGKMTTNPAVRVDGSEKIKFHGENVELPDRNIWIAINKPDGYITSRDDQFDRPVVMDLLPQKYKKLFPVGRLDYRTTGLLLFTNDGELANRMLHPRYNVPREYLVTIEGNLSPEKIATAKNGIVIDNRPAIPVKLILRSKKRNREKWIIEFVEGRYHEVRRFFEALGYRVRSLTRLSFGGISLGNLQKGKWRLISDSEIQNLKDRLEKY